MENLTWNDIYDVLRNFLYNYTELAIWLGIALLLVTLFWMLIYSFEVRRLFAIVLLLLIIVGYGLFYFGVFYSPTDPGPLGPR